MIPSDLDPAEKGNDAAEDVKNAERCCSLTVAGLYSVPFPFGVGGRLGDVDNLL